MDAGPYAPVVPAVRNRPNWLAEAALDAYPPIPLPVWDDTYDQVRVLDAHLMPAIPREIVEYWQEEETLDLLDLPDVTFPSPPSTADLEAVLGYLLGYTDDEAAQVATLAGRLGLDAVTRFLADLPAETRDGRDGRDDVLAALLALDAAGAPPAR